MTIERTGKSETKRKVQRSCEFGKKFQKKFQFLWKKLAKSRIGKGLAKMVIKNIPPIY